MPEECDLCEGRGVVPDPHHGHALKCPRGCHPAGWSQTPASTQSKDESGWGRRRQVREHLKAIADILRAVKDGPDRLWVELVVDHTGRTQRITGEEFGGMMYVKGLTPRERKEHEAEQRVRELEKELAAARARARSLS